MPVAARIVRVAVPSPLARHFDYLPKNGEPLPATGTRVWVPFGRREVIGVVLGTAAESEVPVHKLKPIRAVLDAEPLLPSTLLELLGWAAGYYHYPIGEVLSTALPVLLRRGRSPTAANVVCYVLVDQTGQFDAENLKRAPVQRHLYRLLETHPDGLTAAEISAQIEGWQAPMKRLLDRGLIRTDTRAEWPAPIRNPESAPELVPDQMAAIAEITASTGYQCHLVYGVTGSGKTEVYLGAIAAVLARGGQVLVLVPEIGLTPQLVSRFERRLGRKVAVLHSALNDGERLAAWQAARSGAASVLIGTRSAVYSPMPRLGMIIVDEEHDVSFKQQDGFRYHARDVAIKRASLEGVPVVLGSATPALESIHNADEGRYRLLPLPERAGTARSPRVAVLDLRNLKCNEGVSPPLMEAMRERLRRGEQSLLFLNRRGFAPVLMCHDCGWLAACRRCDARMTLHQRSRKLHCHHCGAESPMPSSCPGCGSGNLHGLGEGTERIETALTRQLPQARIVRVDRDSTRRKGSLEEVLARIARGEADILIGTQMLAKGHDFPNLTLVGVLNADQGLYSTDFRGEERLVQQLVQVTGRAGRADKPGEVLVQTWHPDNPVFSSLVHHDYGEFARQALVARATAGYPPYSHLALWRAESAKPGMALDFLGRVRERCLAYNARERITVYDPAASPMERRAGRYRAQLLVQSTERRALHAMLNMVMTILADDRQARAVRWSLDVDPVEMY